MKAKLLGAVVLAVVLLASQAKAITVDLGGGGSLTGLNFDGTVKLYLGYANVSVPAAIPGQDFCKWTTCSPEPWLVDYFNVLLFAPDGSNSLLTSNGPILLFPRASEGYMTSVDPILLFAKELMGTNLTLQIMIFDCCRGVDSVIPPTGRYFLLEYDPPSAVPIPAALPLFATGLGLLGWLGWRKRRA